MRTAFLSLILLTLPLAQPRAAGLPDLKSQDAWTDKEKKEVLDYLKTSQPMPAGQVKSVAHISNGVSTVPRKPAFASLALQSEALVINLGGGKAKTETSYPGPKLLAGGHLFSWVRYYTGLKYNSMGQDRLDGGRSRISHLEIPAGLELALIPLGTPQTRYVLLRGGVSAHRFSSSARNTAFAAPLLGWHPAWNLGLGYEWQFDNSRWRFHSLAEGYRSFARSGKTSFSGLGLTAGFVYTF